LFIGATMSLVCLGLAGCGGGEVLPLATLERLDKEGDDGLRLKSTGALYTGYLVEYYTGSSTNQLRSRSMIRDGKLNGLSEGWFAGGEPQVAETFIDGKSHGTRVKWHRNGVKEAEDAIEHGELSGPCRKWHENGQLAEQMTMVSGQADGQARSWHPDGSKKAEVRLEMGKVVEQEFWKQGKRPGESKSIAK
jgi:antitoxin component YwqK of YwqJK toxin-antitoxin module